MYKRKEQKEEHIVSFDEIDRQDVERFLKKRKEERQKRIKNLYK